MTYSYEFLFETMTRALAETLESMAFMEVTAGLSDEEAPYDDELLWSGIDVAAPFQGRITLVMPQGLALEMTETMFGFGEIETPLEDLARDTLAEIINTLAGRLMAGIVPEDQTFELGLPETGEGWPDTHAPKQEFRLSVEGETVFLLTGGGLVGERSA
jgi:CheY-specific phosphatase CheX